MLTLALVATAVAVALWLGPVAGGARRRLTPPRQGPATGRGRRRLAVPVAVATAGAVVVLRIVAGGQAAAPAVAALAAAVTTAALFRAGRRRRAARETGREVAHACTVLARLVAVGQIPAEALQVTAEDCPVLAESAAMQAVGGDPVEVWRRQAATPGCGGLMALARAWQVSRVTGASMARPLRDVADALSADESLSRVVAAELSAPRATGRLLAVLPLFGLLLGFVIGGDPLRFLLVNWVGQLCLVMGVLLACAGVLWVERLATRSAGL